MQTQVIHAEAPEVIESALEVLRRGGLVGFPTDTVYGVGALAFDEQAVKLIYEAKGRSDEKAIPVLLGEEADIDKVAMALPDRARKLAQRFWPGALTLVVLKQPGLPAAISATETVGVRMPDHDVARALLRAAGPMAVTSANLSAHPSPRTANEVRAQLEGRIPLIVDGGRTPGGVPSTVLDCTGGELRILRAGPISLEEINAVLG